MNIEKILQKLQCLAELNQVTFKLENMTVYVGDWCWIGSHYGNWEEFLFEALVAAEIYYGIKNEKKYQENK
jgi:hypothetical protein